MAYDTGRRIVAMVDEDLTPRKIMTKRAFENAIVVASAIAASSNAPIHINAIARHVGVELTNDDWQRVGRNISIIANCQPAGEYLGEDFYRAGGIPAVMQVLLAAGKLHGDALDRLRPHRRRQRARQAADRPQRDHALRQAAHGQRRVDRDEREPLRLRGHEDLGHQRRLPRALSVRSRRSRRVRRTRRRVRGPRGLSRAHRRPVARDRRDDCILVMRYCGPLGYPGSAEVVNMQPPGRCSSAASRRCRRSATGARAAPPTRRRS